MKSYPGGPWIDSHVLSLQKNQLTCMINRECLLHDSSFFGFASKSREERLGSVNPIGLSSCNPAQKQTRPQFNWCKKLFGSKVQPQCIVVDEFAKGKVLFGNSIGVRYSLGVKFNP